MKLITKLFVVGGVIAGAVWIDRQRRRLRDASRETDRGLGEDLGGLDVTPGVTIERVAPRGISDVDPEGLTQFGEAVDPEATEAAHTEIPAQRERLPRP